MKVKMNYLFVGDLHTKYHILEKVKELSKNYDKVIFLGDYVDDWNAVPEASYNLLNSLIDFKKQNTDKVVLLLGNHDLSEWFGRPFACSGYNPLTSNLVKPLFEQNEHLFDIAYSPTPHTIASHAGFTNFWTETALNKKYRSATSLATDINRAFHNRFNYESPHQQEYEKIFYHLADVGYARGGWEKPSPLWADTTELVADWFPFLQIVGHTPHKTITFYNRYNREVYFCDTFSTYTNGTNFGDCSLLTFQDNYPIVIDLDGNDLPW